MKAIQDALTQISNSQESQDRMDITNQEIVNTSQGTPKQGNQQNLNTINTNSEIQQSEMQDIILALQGYIDNMSDISMEDMVYVKELLQHVSTCRVTVFQRITLIPYIRRLSSAIIAREQQLTKIIPKAIEQLDVKVPKIAIATQSQNQVGDPIIYCSLYQYQTDMNQQNIQESITTLKPTAIRQLKHYNDIGLIDRVTRNNKSTLPYYSLFVHCPMIRAYLTKDQCSIIMQNINPNKNVTCREFPQFNPDFHYRCTIFGLHIAQKFEHFTSFTGPHRVSQLNLEQNRHLEEDEVEGRFAYDQQAQWIQLTFDSSLNIEWNERIAFTLVNGQPPSGLQNMDDTRVFCSRCMSTGAWDGLNTYFYCQSAIKMGQTLRALRNLSIHLSTGNYQVNILSPKSLSVSISDIPTPSNYEAIICLQNTWCNLTKRQLVRHLQDKFSPCIIFGSVYLPNYANPAFGITGKAISMMPRFQGHIQESQFEKLFYWSIDRNQWIQNDSSELSAKETYLSQELPTIEKQQETHVNDRKFQSQDIDIYQKFIYGSNHFWTMYRRNKDYNQITSTPMSNFSDFSEGENPYIPSLKDATILDKLLVPRSLPEGNKETCYHMYLDDESQKNLELSMRFRRAQFIMGYNSPYLRYNRLDRKTRQEKRIPSIQEFLTKPLNQIDAHVFRKIDVTKLQWIPRELVSQYDEITGICLPKREMAHLRLKRVDDEARQTQENQQKSKYQKTNRSSFMARIQQLFTILEDPMSKPAILQYTPPTDVSVERVFRDKNLIPISNGYVLESFTDYKSSKQIHQILLKTDEISPLMEWDICDMLAKMCTIKVRVAALRDYYLLYNAHQFLLEVQQDESLIAILQEIVKWPGVLTYVIQEEDQLQFPLNYSYNTLQYGMNFAKVSFHKANTSNTYKWFVQMREDNSTLRQHFPIPGCMLGTNFHANYFYTYEPLTGLYHSDPLQPAHINGQSSTAIAYARRQATFLQLKADCFVEFNQYSTSESMINTAKCIKCPQQSRLYLRHNYMSSITQKGLHQTLARNPQNFHKNQNQKHRDRQQHKQRGVQKRSRNHKKHDDAPIQKFFHHT